MGVVIVSPRTGLCKENWPLSYVSLVRATYSIIGSGQYTLLSGRQVQTGPVLFEFKFTTGIQWNSLNILRRYALPYKKFFYHFLIIDETNGGKISNDLTRIQLNPISLSFFENTPFHIRFVCTKRIFRIWKILRGKQMSFGSSC